MNVRSALGTLLTSGGSALLASILVLTFLDGLVLLAVDAMVLGAVIVAVMMLGAGVYLSKQATTNSRAKQ